jgi:hypothetical protein
VAADGNHADGQPGRAAEELPESFHLVIKLAALLGGQLAERLDGYV